LVFTIKARRKCGKSKIYSHYAQGFLFFNRKKFKIKEKRKERNPFILNFSSQKFRHFFKAGYGFVCTNPKINKFCPARGLPLNPTGMLSLDPSRTLRPGTQGREFRSLHPDQRRAPFGIPIRRSRK
jgi:hypothetical protein